MSSKFYDESRPAISAELRRTIEVESGHCCAIKICGEHTYLEIHHIDQNRNNNKLENLILLCDKHHKMAHREIIDRKALRQYKCLLESSHSALINEKLEEIKALIIQEKTNIPEPEKTTAQPVDDQIKKLSPKRSEILNYALYHIAIAHYEKTNNLYFEHQVEFKRGSSSLFLDALRQDDSLPEDIIIDVHYLRKPYLDAPTYGSWLVKKLDIYRLMTGRIARGILIIVVGRDRMPGDNYLELTRKGVESCEGKISLQVYSCAQVGFDPGAISAACFASNLTPPSEPNSNLT